MALVKYIRQILALPDANGLKTAARPILKPVYGVTGNDRFPAGLAAVDDDALRPVMSGESLSEEAFGGRKITMLAEPELDRGQRLGPEGQGNFDATSLRQATLTPTVLRPALASLGGDRLQPDN